MATLLRNDNTSITVNAKGYFNVKGESLYNRLVNGRKTPVLFEEVLNAEQYINALYRVLGVSTSNPSQTYDRLAELHKDTKHYDTVLELIEAVKTGNIDSDKWTYQLAQGIRNIVAPMREYGIVWHSNYRELEFYEVYRASGDVFSIRDSDVRALLENVRYVPDQKIVRIKDGIVSGDLNVVLKWLCYQDEEKMIDHRLLPFDDNWSIKNGIKIGFEGYENLHANYYNWAAKLGQVIRLALESRVK